MRARQFFGFLVVAMLVYRPAAEGASPTQPTYNEKAVANFYHGKTLRIIVGFTPGGATDVVARTVLSPAELPIGVITAFLGAPFFAIVLRTSRGAR